MTKSKDNEEHDWEGEAELHLMDVCPLYGDAGICMVCYLQVLSLVLFRLCVQFFYLVEAPWVVLETPCDVF